MVHPKVILIDESHTAVGSANMDMRSLFLNYEIVMIAYSKPDVIAIQKWMQGIIDQSREGK
jgi:cardiolipin synthase